MNIEVGKTYATVFGGVVKIISKNVMNSPYEYTGDNGVMYTSTGVVSGRTIDHSLVREIKIQDPITKVVSQPQDQKKIVVGENIAATDGHEYRILATDRNNKKNPVVGMNKSGVVRFFTAKGKGSSVNLITEPLIDINSIQIDDVVYWKGLPYHFAGKHATKGYALVYTNGRSSKTSSGKTVVRVEELTLTK